MLREQIAELKGYLNDKSAPFGVDLLQVSPQLPKSEFRHPTHRSSLLLPEISMLTRISEQDSPGWRRSEKNEVSFWLSTQFRPATDPHRFSYDYTKGKLDELVGM